MARKTKTQTILADLARLVTTATAAAADGSISVAEAVAILGCASELVRHLATLRRSS